MDEIPRLSDQDYKSNLNGTHILIGADYLRGIDLILQSTAQDLAHHIRTIGGREMLENPDAGRGQSIFTQIPVEIRLVDARAIQEALNSKSIGAERVFEGRSVGGIRAVWQNVINRLEERARTEE